MVNTSKTGDGAPRRAWRGRSQVSHKMGAPVRLGDYVVPRALTWTVRGSLGDPDLRVEFEVRNGRPECTEVHVIAKPDGRAVQDCDLAALDLEAAAVGIFTDNAFRMVSESEAVMPGERSERDLWKARGQVTKAAKQPRGVSRAELEQVAELYLEHADGTPLKMLEAVLGYSTRTAARRAQQAREAGLLPPLTQSRKG
jgi:hypothetical protein